MTHRNTYFFLGIGGIGMSALAKYCLLKGHLVGGYDALPTEITKALSKLGAAIVYFDSVKSIPEFFLDPSSVQVVFTPAIPKTSKLYSYFLNGAFKMQKRAAMLGEVTADSFSYAVGGTHGKTTTSSILAHLLDASGIDIAAFLGGVAHNFESNLVLKDTAITVVEADEFDRSFLHLSPNVACITGTDADHLDIYKTKEALETAFVDFSNRLKPNGLLFVHESVAIQGSSYGLSEHSDYYLSNIHSSDGKVFADIHTPRDCFEKVLFPMPGVYNMLNALVAFAMAYSQDIPVHKLIAALASFKGVKRRFSYEINTSERIYIDDYAHHPTAIEAIYQTIKTLYPLKEITLVFQPHLYSRTKDFANEFAAALSLFDRLLLMEIYPAREQPIEGVTAAWLLTKVTTQKALVTHDNLIKKIKSIDPELLLTLGAGDIGLEVKNIKAALS